MRGTLLQVTALLAAGTIIAGCGAKSHENEPRPPIPAVVTVTVGADEIDVSPAAAGEPGERGPYLNQNRNAPQNQSDRRAPLVVNIAVANLTREDTELTIEGPVGRVEKLVAAGSAAFNMALPTGVYRLSSPASTDTTRLTVGRSRISSGGDVLIP